MKQKPQNTKWKKKNKTKKFFYKRNKRSLFKFEKWDLGIFRKLQMKRKYYLILQ